MPKKKVKTRKSTSARARAPIAAPSVPANPDRPGLQPRQALRPQQKNISGGAVIAARSRKTETQKVAERAKRKKALAAKKAAKGGGGKSDRQFRKEQEAKVGGRRKMTTPKSATKKVKVGPVTLVATAQGTYRKEQRRTAVGGAKLKVSASHPRTSTMDAELAKIGPSAKMPRSEKGVFSGKKAEEVADPGTRYDWKRSTAEVIGRSEGDRYVRKTLMGEMGAEGGRIAHGLGMYVGPEDETARYMGASHSTNAILAQELREGEFNMRAGHHEAVRKPSKKGALATILQGQMSQGRRDLYNALADDDDPDYDAIRPIKESGGSGAGAAGGSKYNPKGIIAGKQRRPTKVDMTPLRTEPPSMIGGAGPGRVINQTGGAADPRSVVQRVRLTENRETPVGWQEGYDIDTNIESREVGIGGRSRHVGEVIDLMGASAAASAHQTYTAGFHPGERTPNQEAAEKSAETFSAMIKKGYFN